jgi:hypothetical protein
MMGILISLFLVTIDIPSARAQNAASTPTNDPFAQPELPPDPTDLEMGRYLFWRHCMPCHGDVGQGLTDDFRSLWEDHQNCWEQGCHGGKSDDEGFPIPTIIPAIVTGDHLSQFRSEEELFDFLKATHPPQYPGFLKDEEYHDIAVVLFRMNSRILDEEVSVPSLSPASTPSGPAELSEPVDNKTANTNSQMRLIVIGLSIVLLAGITFGVLNRIRIKNSKEG